MLKLSAVYQRFTGLSKKNIPILYAIITTQPLSIEGVSHSSLLFFGRSGPRPSLVRGDSPRNAPLQKHAPPPHQSPAPIP